jgi:hypothetical protein
VLSHSAVLANNAVPYVVLHNTVYFHRSVLATTNYIHKAVLTSTQNYLTALFSAIHFL